jgi:hypothetical protein
VKGTFGILRESWGSLYKGLRVLCLVMWAAGAVCLLLGALGDVSKFAGTSFWEDKSFLTNVASSLTTALIGVPTAIVVIEALLDRRTEYAERKRLTDHALNAARQLDEWYARLYELQPPTIDHESPSRPTEVLAANVADATAKVGDGASLVTEDLRLDIDDLVARWNRFGPKQDEIVVNSAMLYKQGFYMDSYLHYRFLEVGLIWVSADLFARYQSKLNEVFVAAQSLPPTLEVPDFHDRDLLSNFFQRVKRIRQYFEALKRFGPLAEAMIEQLEKRAELLEKVIA